MFLCVFIILALLWEHIYVEMCKKGERERHKTQFSNLPAFLVTPPGLFVTRGVLFVVSAHCISHHFSY